LTPLAAGFAREHRNRSRFIPNVVGSSESMLSFFRESFLFSVGLGGKFRRAIATVRLQCEKKPGVAVG
jgi:hypothetical protein